VFVAEGVQGQVTAVARKEASEYAFYRGTTYVGQPPMPARAQAGVPQGQAIAPAPNAPAMDQALDANLKLMNESNSARQIQRLQERYQRADPAKAKGAAVGGFR
jgi:hypothetical protein